MRQFLVRIKPNAAVESGIKFGIGPLRWQVAAKDVPLIEVKGWVFSTEGLDLELVDDREGRFPDALNAERPGVVRVHAGAPLRCGFSVLWNTDRGFKLGVSILGKTIWLADVFVERIKVLNGHDGYLFLDNDQNRSVDQFSGKTLIDAANMALWGQYFDMVNRKRVEVPFAFVFVMVPSKEYFFPEYYPVKKAIISSLEQFVFNFSAVVELLCPLIEIGAEKHYCFSRNDTHWTDYGAGVAARLCCERLGVDFVDQQPRYRFMTLAGDLGSKLHPELRETLPVADFAAVVAGMVFDNGVSHRGWIRIFQNPGHDDLRSCVVFGDSFSMRMVQHLFKSFRRVVHVFSGADIDWSIVDCEKPDVVIVELTSRFVLKAPSISFDVKSEIRRKYASASTGEWVAAEARARMGEKVEPFYSALTTQVLALLADSVKPVD